MAELERRFVTLEDVRIAFKNFAGKEAQYNAKGKRVFSVMLEPETAEAMAADGWNIKYLKQREDEEAPQAFIQVEVSYKNENMLPRVVVITSRGRENWGEEQLSILDWAEIKHVDLSVNPYNWEVRGESGRKAYLRSLFVTLQEDELDLKYADIPDSGAPESAQSVVGVRFEDEG